MFNLKEYEKRRVVNQEFKSALEQLENTQRFICEQQYKYDVTCEHDLIIYFGKEGYCTPETGYSECLCCGKIFRLNDYCPKEIPSEKIINLVGSVPEEYFYTCNDKGNILVTRAKEKLDELATLDEKLPIEMVRQIIINDLCKFTEDKKCEREDYLARVRKTENKK